MKTLYRLYFKCISFTFGVSALAACSAQTPTVPADWKSDCVGRMQLSFPGEVDVAANPFKKLLGEYSVGSQVMRYEYPDGQVSDYNYIWNLGLVFVSHPLVPDARKQLLDAANAKTLRAQAYVKKGNKDNYGNSLVFESLSVAPLTGYSYRVNNRVEMSIELGEHVIRLARSTAESDPDWGREYRDAFIKGASTRSIGQLPLSRGACLPYTFIKNDDDTPRRHIRIAYRLKDHPDVQIVLKDASAADTEPGIRTQNAEPLPVIQSLWDQHLTFFAKDAKNEWARGGHPVTLAGYKGLSSFVKFIRHDDAVDYGYAAVVRGDPNAKEDTPDLMLYVIRSAKDATAKGKEPISKDEFIKLAETVAASVKRRSPDANK